MALKISISGAAGSGKSTLIKAIVEKYGMETTDVGKVFFRDRAIARGITVAEYDKIVETEPEEDRAIEAEVKKFVENSPKDIIVGRRMGFHIMPDIVSIWLDVSPEEGAKRVFLDDRGKQEKKYASVEEALSYNQSRMERLRERLLHVYGVDFTDKANYTKVIDTTGKTFEQNFEQLDQYIQSLRK
ncbi:MAG: (d)CMP kinase [candidate division SR1 bacterium]|nr:(d)CMP kinase [candidate division SR1 bacterium]